MDDKIQLISDGDGLAVVGNGTAVERFLDSVGLLTWAQDLGLDRLSAVLSAGAIVAQGVSETVANAGLYLKLVPESAQRVKELGLMETKMPGISYAMLGDPGSISGWLKIETGFESFITNPAVLSGVSGIMTQLATQQSMAEITAYLANIDEKVDDVLRKLDDAEVAKLVGIGHAIDRVMIIREATGEVSQTLWSTVDQSHATIGAAQTYALDQLDRIAMKLESPKVGGLVNATRQAESEVPRMLAVLARSFQLEDAINVIELDRELADNRERVAAYRVGMKKALEKRRDVVSDRTKNLLDRMEAAVGTANTKLVWSRTKAMEVVESANQLASEVQDFHGLLKIEADLRSWEQRQLGRVADTGSQVIQKSKDVAPLIGAGLGLIGLIGFAAQKSKEEQATEEV